MAAEEEVYKPQDAVAQSVQATLIVGGAGLLISTVQNTLTRQNVGAWGVITRTGGTIGIFGLISDSTWDSCTIVLIGDIAAMGGTFEFVRIASANLREKDDSWNPAIGGFFAGGILGMKCQLWKDWNIGMH